MAETNWSEAELAEYVEERERAANRVPDNIVTEYEKPRQLPRMESALRFNPHKWR